MTSRWPRTRSPRANDDAERVGAPSSSARTSTPESRPRLTREGCPSPTTLWT
uniref:Uncharacterized protein n=1 Tax=uncultured marine virus TaxID=186617 RepID=A0A0F7LAM8_9VIRU|nr:hypothetical protein [uncultured marine virus]